MQLSPFGRSRKFHKGNMHAHSTSSDGVHPPEKVCAAYRDQGYDFLVMTDHFMARFG